MFSISPRVKEKWYIVFENGAKIRWYTKYLKKGFTHCYCMRKSDGEAFWLVINPLFSHTVLDYRAVDTFPNVRDYTGDLSTVIEYNAIINPYTSVGTLSVNTCVDVVKRFIGIKSFFIFTPWQLYKHLRGVNNG